MVWNSRPGGAGKRTAVRRAATSRGGSWAAPCAQKTSITTARHLPKCRLSARQALPHLWRPCSPPPKILYPPTTLQEKKKTAPRAFFQAPGGSFLAATLNRFVAPHGTNLANGTGILFSVAALPFEPMSWYTGIRRIASAVCDRESCLREPIMRTRGDK